jgi:hypothetical protein
MVIDFKWVSHALAELRMAFQTKAGGAFGKTCRTPNE